ncbi:type II toxin-antitoxin system VapB family antitoxin [Streptomyces sp. NPDC005962]|uniref:type II toxin-antitoxin system VapB family antitoxin n=1 Tax=Streptomyces sp. NPDC005962 TaxID=3154466 RepID=UPI0033E25EEE
MARTVIDLDDDLLAEAQKALGTSTKVGTVNAALLEVVKRLRRQEFFDAIDSGEIDLTYDARGDTSSGPHDQAAA